MATLVIAWGFSDVPPMNTKGIDIMAETKKLGQKAEILIIDDPYVETTPRETGVLEQEAIPFWTEYWTLPPPVRQHKQDFISTLLGKESS